MNNSLGVLPAVPAAEANQRTEGEAALGAGEGDAGDAGDAPPGEEKNQVGHILKRFSHGMIGMLMIIDYPIIIFYSLFCSISSVLMLKITFYAAFPTAIDLDGTSNRYSQGESDTTLDGSYLQAAMQRKLGPKGPSMKNNKAGRTLG